MATEKEMVSLMNVHTLSTYDLRQELTRQEKMDEFFPEGKGVNYETLLQAMVHVLREREAAAQEKHLEALSQEQASIRAKQAQIRQERKKEALERSEARMAAKKAQEALSSPRPVFPDETSS